jgi:tetrapyrrole methylase family protein/MazG family protein
MVFSKKGCRRSKIVLDFLCKESYDLRDFVALVSYLRSPRGCPWDQVQTHESIRRNFLEETYEACEAIDAGDLVHMREELGDVLMQVLFHTDIEREAGHFDIDDVADAACKKLVYRHPHVFRRDEPDAPDWDTMKQRERAQTTTAEAMDSVARSLPALWRCDKIQAKAAKTGFEWPDVHAALDKVDEETRELRAAVASGDTEAIGDELGDLLFAAVKVARFAGIDPEQAAHAACEKFIRRFSAMETAAANDGTALEQCTLAQMLTLWQQAKQTVSAEQESRKSARQ